LNVPSTQVVPAIENRAKIEIKKIILEFTIAAIRSIVLTQNLAKSTGRFETTKLRIELTWALNPTDNMKSNTR
jgi:hypothetical protein